MEPEETEDAERKGRTISWAAMLWMVLLAILVAAGCAYELVNPFFHQRPPTGY